MIGAFLVVAVGFAVAVVLVLLLILFVVLLPNAPVAVGDKPLHLCPRSYPSSVIAAVAVLAATPPPHRKYAQDAKVRLTRNS